MCWPSTDNMREEDGSACVSHPYFDFADDFPRGLQLLERLSRRDRVDHDKGVAFGDVQPLHGRKLVGARRVGDLKRADGVLVARYHLGER